MCIFDLKTDFQIHKSKPYQCQFCYRIIMKSSIILLILLLSIESYVEASHSYRDYGYVAKLKTLYPKNTDVDAKGGHGMTPLMIATANRDIKSLEMLIENKSNVNAKDDYEICCTKWQQRNF